MYSMEELADDFQKLGIKPGDTVMLHASVRAVGEVAGGSMTSILPCVEHIVDIPEKRVARYRVPIMENGRRVWRAMTARLE